MVDGQMAGDGSPTRARTQTLAAFLESLGLLLCAVQEVWDVTAPTLLVSTSTGTHGPRHYSVLGWQDPLGCTTATSYISAIRPS